MVTRRVSEDRHGNPTRQRGTIFFMLRHVKQIIGRWWKASDRFSLGPAGEKAAAIYLQKLGYRIIARGHRQKLGEVDLIALDGKCLVFVEVKTWNNDHAGDPSQAVDLRKQERLTRAALIYMKRRGLLDQPARFDVVSIVWSKTAETAPTIRHFISAFEAVGKYQMYR
jgi:putative endonuclease